MKNNNNWDEEVEDRSLHQGDPEDSQSESDTHTHETRYESK
jgi:hypothetical protein